MINIISKFFSYLRREKLVFGITTNAQKKRNKNKYELIDYYVENDTSLYGTLRFIALSVGTAYKGYSKKHKNITNEAYSIAFNLMKYGDVIIHKKTQKMLPLYALTIVDSKERINNYSSDVITDIQYYVINEKDKNKMKIYNKDDIIHISLNNIGTMTTDILGRYCYGIYSLPPTVPLLKILEWKEFLIDSDIMWRDRMIPREHHTLNTELSYDMIPGKNLDEKRKNAMMMIQEQLVQYANSISNMESGEQYVTTKDVDIKVIEPKTSYQTPNELVDQLTDIIISSFNVPISAIKGNSKSSYAAELAVASYFMLTANSLVDKINEYLEWKYEGTDFSDANITLEVWKTETFKRAALASQIGVFTIDEIRNIAGYTTPINNNSDIVNNKTDGRTIDSIIRNANPSDVETSNRNDTRNKQFVDRNIGA